MSSHDKLAFHRRTGSSGLAPTRGEFQIMRHLGEEAYSQMKAMRSSQPSNFATQMMITNNDRGESGDEK